MATLAVRVTPRSSRDGIAGFDASGALKVRVAAPPTEGAANAAVTKLLAKSLGLPARDIVLLRGASSRVKLFQLPLSDADIRARLDPGT